VPIQYRPVFWALPSVLAAGLLASWYLSDLLVHCHLGYTSSAEEQRASHDKEEQYMSAPRGEFSSKLGFLMAAAVSPFLGGYLTTRHGQISIGVVNVIAVAMGLTFYWQITRVIRERSISYSG